MKTKGNKTVVATLLHNNYLIAYIYSLLNEFADTIT